jgi:acetyl-CoA synthetase
LSGACVKYVSRAYSEARRVDRKEECPNNAGGREMKSPDGDTYETIRAAFQWDVPTSFNMGVDCCDRHPPSRTALIYVASNEVRTYTFGDLRDLSNRLANVLASLGIKKGDRVGIVLPQRPETAIAHLAVYKLGGVALPLSALFGPDALKFRLGDAGAKAVIVDLSGLQKVEAIWGELQELRAILVVDVLSADDSRIIDWNAVEAASNSYEPADTKADDPALLIYTSGTTGPPKGALHAQRVLIGHLPGFELSHEFFPKDGDRFWTPADWAWIGGLMDALLPSWHHGVPVVASARQGFDPEWAFELLVEHRIVNAFLPPTALKLLRQAGLSRKGLRLRTVMSGGEVLGEEILEWGQEILGLTVNEIYGQTEANYIVGNCAPVWNVRPGSMGRPYPGHDVEILDENGNPAPVGEPGEVAVRAPDPVMFLEYWGQLEATRDKFIGDWALTGDTASCDEEGYLWFRGRKDDVINSAGYRIGPSEIEECLIHHEAVAMAAAIGIPDETRGEVVKAFIKLRRGHEPSSELEESIRRHVRDRLAAYQYPRSVEFIDELPMTTTGKIQRTELRKMEAQRRESKDVIG